MNVLVLGATGMVGQGVLRECLLDSDVHHVATLGRRPTGQIHEKLEEIIHQDLFELAPVQQRLSGFDTCMYCLGVSAVGLTEAAYARVTHDLTIAIASTLISLNPEMTFIFVSGGGSDRSGQSRMMWARVKGRTENALLKYPFRAVYIFRPGAILPMHGIRSRTRLYNAIYTMLRPISPLVRRLAPDLLTTTEQLGRAMVAVARHGHATSILEMRDIRRF